MGILRTILFVAVAIIVVVIFVINEVLRVLARRYTRQQHELVSYESDRRVTDQWILEKWETLQNEVVWLDDRRNHPESHGGKHVKSVSREEIDRLIKDCNEFSDKIREAIDNEHKKFKQLPRDYRRILREELHGAWHQTDKEVQEVKRKFENLRLTGWQ